MKKKICWITPDCYLDTDIYIVPLLAKEFNIEWYIYYTSAGTLSYKDSLDKIRDIKIHIVCIDGRFRSVNALKVFFELVKNVRKSKPDLVYTGISGAPYFLPLLKIIVGSKNVVIAAHNVVTPKGAISYNIAKRYTFFALNMFDNFHTFSESQYKVLLNKYPNKNVLVAPFILKDYGLPSTKPNDVITFLSFGFIRDYKRIDVLINAVQNAYEKTRIKCKVIIAGSCDDWSKYDAIIKYPELFDLRIRRVENDEVADLFGLCHYFVAPYQDIAQSGSVVVALNYSKPIIASDLEAFREFIKDKQTGYLMKPASVEDLTSIIIGILKNHTSVYQTMCNNIEEFKRTNYSESSIVNKYSSFFNDLIG